MAMWSYETLVGEKDNKFHPTKLDYLIPTTTRVVILFCFFTGINVTPIAMVVSVSLCMCVCVCVLGCGAKAQVHWFSHSFTVLYCSEQLAKMIPTGYCLLRWIHTIKALGCLDMLEICGNSVPHRHGGPRSQHSEVVGQLPTHAPNSNFGHRSCIEAPKQNATF